VKPNHRVLVFSAVTLVSSAVAVGYVTSSAGRDDRSQGGAVKAQAVAMSFADVTDGPHVVFRSLTPGDDGRLAAAPLSDPDGERAVTDQRCMRVYASATNGLCLSEQGDLFTPYDIRFLDADMRTHHTESLSGLISRARISPDASRGAATVFVTGHTYANGAFSTETTLHDMATGEMLGGLEGFDVYKDGAEFKSIDFNFWGVTFTADPDVFYATLGTDGHTYLVKGDMETYTMEVVRDGVECPSLSPDGKRLAFKHKVRDGDNPQWVPAVLDLKTMKHTVLAETRSVDDQIEWLDDDTVVYAVDSGEGAVDVFATPADGGGAPTLFLTDADSPAVVR
jgi:Tol biopolymer transport system component